MTEKRGNGFPQEISGEQGVDISDPDAIREILEHSPADKRLGVILFDEKGRNPWKSEIVVCSVLDLRARKNLPLGGFTFSILDMNPGDNFTEVYAHRKKERFARRREEAFIDNIERNEHTLAQYGDGQELLITGIDSLDMPDSWLEVTAKEARELNRTMRNPENDFSVGVPQIMVIISDQPNMYMEMREEKLSAEKRKLLALLNPHTPDTIVWYALFSGSNISSKKTTVADLREKILSLDVFDWEEKTDNIPRIISINDSAFDGVIWKKQYLQRRSNTINTAIDTVNTLLELREQIEDIDPGKIVTLLFSKSQRCERLKQADALALVWGSNFTETVVREGLPTVIVSVLQ